MRVFWIIVAIAFAAGMPLVAPAQAEDAVTEWTVQADWLGDGGANWHTLAVMHMAMHDAAQTVAHDYARWFPGDVDRATSGLPTEVSQEATIASAAATILLALHPGSPDETRALLRRALAHVPAGPEKEGGIALGEAIGREVLIQRQADGYRRIHPFAADTRPGRWRPAPPDFQGSNTTDARPFLFAGRTWPGERPPPSEGSGAFDRDVVEINALGSAQSTMRTPAQTEEAEFWAYQSSQRGFVLLAVQLLDASPALNLPQRARQLSLLTAAMADAAILTWAEKEQYSSWRPITVMRSGASGFPARSDWVPLIDTPPHPEYPSGHATDCFTGAGMLKLLFYPSGPIDYVAQSALATSDTAEIGMGQHAQPGGLHAMRKHYPSLETAADECAASRIWAGAHFRSANEESHRLAAAIIARAQAALPKLVHRP